MISFNDFLQESKKPKIKKGMEPFVGTDIEEKVVEYHEKALGPNHAG